MMLRTGLRTTQRPTNTVSTQGPAALPPALAAEIGPGKTYASAKREDSDPTGNTWTFERHDGDGHDQAVFGAKTLVGDGTTKMRPVQITHVRRDGTNGPTEDWEVTDQSKSGAFNYVALTGMLPESAMYGTVSAINRPGGSSQHPLIQVDPRQAENAALLISNTPRKPSLDLEVETQRVLAATGKRG